MFVQECVLLLCWHGATAHWIGLRQGYFWGCSGACMGPHQNALIKRSSLGGWKVSYQLHCRSLMGPTRLHLVNTFCPSLARILKRPLALPSTLNISPSTTFPLTLYRFLYQSIKFHTKYNLATILLFNSNFVIRSTLSPTLSRPPSPPSLPCLICFTLLMKGKSRGVFCFDHMTMPWG